MHAIVLTFETERDQFLRDIQQELQARFGLSHVPTHPHCSFHVALSYNFELTEAVLTHWAQRVPPLRLTASGYGLFPHDNDVVIYSTISQTPRLTAIHVDLYNCMLPATKQIHSLFAPDRWVPHVTYGNLPKTSFSSAMGWLVEQPPYWASTCTEVAIMEFRNGTYVKRFATELCGKPDTL
ncbi:MAG: 2'-5' RNA ligase family protein [Candidatus Promineifilaceae bacterium]